MSASGPGTLFGVSGRAKIRFDRELHVAKNGSPGGDGSLDLPFLTIQGALNYAVTLGLSATQKTAIYVHPGLYDEDIVQPAWTFIIGFDAGNETAEIGDAGPVRTWTNAADDPGRMGAYDLFIRSQMTIDTTAFVPAGGLVYEMVECTMSASAAPRGSITCTFRAGVYVDFLQMERMNIFGSGVKLDVDNGIYVGERVELGDNTQAIMSGDCFGRFDNSFMLGPIPSGAPGGPYVLQVLDTAIIYLTDSFVDGDVQSQSPGAFGLPGILWDAESYPREKTIGARLEHAGAGTSDNITIPRDISPNAPWPLGNPNGNVHAGFGEEFYDTTNGIWYKQVTYPSGTVWVVI